MTAWIEGSQGISADTPIQNTEYRGYKLVFDPSGCDVWQGGHFVCTEPSLDQAKTVIDEWLHAP